jgi:hypothetical protein
MGKKNSSAGKKKLEKKIDSATEKTYGKSYPAPNPEYRAKGVIVHEGTSKLVKDGKKPAIEASDTNGEIRTFPVSGNKLKNFNKNVAKAESRSRVFINETAGRQLEENK